MDFFTFANVVELLNVMHSGSYFGLGISLKERESFIHARKMVRRVITWFFSSRAVHTLDGPIADGALNVYCKYLVRQIRTIYALLQKMNYNPSNNSLGCDAETFAASIELTFSNYKGFAKMFKQEGSWNVELSSLSFAWTESRTWSVMLLEKGPVGE